MTKVAFFVLVAMLCTPLVAQTSDSKSVVSPPLLSYPVDIAAGPDGVIYVADPHWHGVWKWSGDKAEKLVQGTKMNRTPLNATRAVAVAPDGTVLVADTAMREVYRVGKDGKLEPITDAQLGTPLDMAVKTDGTIYIADAEVHKLLRIDAKSGKVEFVADVNPRGVFVDSEQQVWVVSMNPEQLLIVADDGSVKEIVGERTFNFPHQVVVNAAGDAFVTDGYEKAIWKVAKGGKPEVWFKGEPLQNPVGICLVDDLPVVVDPRAAKVFKFDKEGKPSVLFEIKP